MIRLTRKVFNDLAVWMTGLGLVIGIVFPVFLTFLGVPRWLALTPLFFAACITAGILLGGINIALARSVVGHRLRTLSGHMHLVEDHLREIGAGGDMERCTDDLCLIEIDSEDEIGESARAFN